MFNGAGRGRVLPGAVADWEVLAAALVEGLAASADAVVVAGASVALAEATAAEVAPRADGDDWRVASHALT